MFLKSILSKFNGVLILGTHKNLLIKGAFNFSSTKNPLLELSKSNSLNKIYFSTSIVKKANLIEFFDDKKNWTEEKVKHGRPWTIDELRLKSNLDLHKLWFVLHKERNMLLTMEEIYTRKGIPMPSHERVAKVDESMENLLAVVEERNIAYNLLETGETKKLVPYRRYNSFGHIQYYKQREYLVPWYLNRMWKLKYHYKKIPYWSKFYTSLNRVMLRKERRKTEKKVMHSVKKVIEKFPDLHSDEIYLKEYFSQKYGYKPPRPYHELIKKPSPNELPKKLQESMRLNESVFKEEF